MKNIKAKKAHNILYTTSFSYMAGGGQWSLYYLIKHLNKDIFHPIVLCPDDGELAEKMRSVGADVIFLNVGRIRRLNPFVIKRLVSIIKDKNISLVHTDSTTENFYAGIAAKIAGIPLVWHIRTSEGEYFLDRVLSFLSTKLILVADALKSRFRWLEKTQKLVTIYNGIDLEEFDSFSATPSSIRKESGIGESEILLACVGRIEKRKGQEYLISAMKHADNVKLIFAGKADEVYLRQITTLCEDLNICDKIIFAGHRNDIPSFLRSIDIPVFPTLTEGFSRVLLEAMAAGRPVIATDVGGNSEAIIDGITGYVVPAKKPEALAHRINELTSNKEKRKRMGLSGRQRIEKGFAIERHAKAVEELYKEIIVNKDE